MTRWLMVVVAAVPGLVLAVAGLFHPAQLTPATAPLWWQLHIALLPVFPLLAVGIVALLRGERGWLPWLARVAAYVYAVYYTGLDTLAGIGAGLAVDTGPGGSPVALRLLAVGNELAVYGVHAYLVAALATAVVLVRRDGVRAAPGAVLLVAAAVPFLQSHIYWPVGGTAMLGIAAGGALLEWARASGVGCANGT
jgi:hypothetical protein